MTFDDLPYWLQHELETPAAVGTRSNHCIKIAPALLRNGYTPEQTLAALYKLYPHAGTELEGLVGRAEVYAQTEREADPEWAARAARAAELTEKAQKALPRIIDEWQMPDLETTIPELSLPIQRRMFIDGMFGLEDVIWIGEPTHSGPNFRHHFKAVRTWMNRRTEIPGEFVSHCIYKPGTVHRNTESIAERRYLVLESDILPPGELAAVARFLSEHEKLTLHAIVTTGGKRHAPEPGLHFWLKFPGLSTLPDWEAVLRGYGADVATLRGPQPVRLPGCIRKSTGLPQQLLFLRK